MLIRTIAIILVIILKGPVAFAQYDSLKAVNLNEVIVTGKAIKGAKIKNKTRVGRVYFHIPAAQNSAHFDSTFLTTKYPVFDSSTIKLYNIEMKLEEYDNNLFDIYFVVFQPNKDDTVAHIIKIDANSISKSRVVIDVKPYNIILQPKEFYIGIGFHPKNNLKPITYKLYSSTSGEGAIINLKMKSEKIMSSPILRYNFPFKIQYITF